MNNSDIREKLNSIKDLPTLPAIAMELNRMLQDAGSTVDTISEKIETDQSISSKVLKLINSAFFGLRSQVTNIHDAVVLLGFNSVRNIVLSVSVIKAFKEKDGEYGYDMSTFWQHSIATAITGKYLSEISGKGEPGDCFTTGLLHDIGKVILAQYFSDLFIQIIGAMKEKSIPFSKAEKEYLGQMGHARIGGFLAEKWRFPSSLTRTIEEHHTLSGKFSDIGSVTHVADIIVNIQNVNASGLDLVQKKSMMPVMNRESVEMLKEHIGTSSKWYPELTEKIDDACSFFAES